MRRASFIRFVILGLCAIGCIMGGARLSAQEYPGVNKSDSALITVYLKKAVELQYRSADSAIVLGKKALAISRRLHYDRHIARSLITIASFYHKQKKYLQCKAYALEALSFCGSPGTADLLPTIYNGIGSIYVEESTFDSASYFFTQALHVIDTQKTKDISLLTSVYANLGSNFSNMGQHDQAVRYMQKSIALAIQRKDTGKLAFGYYDIGNAYFNAGKIDSAIKYFTMALPLYQEIRQPGYVQQAYSLLGHAYMERKDMGKARLYFDSAIAVDKVAAENVYSIHQGKGMLYLSEGNYAMGIKSLEQSQQICERQGLRQAKLNAYKLLAGAYEKLGKFHQAHDYIKRYLLLQDTLMNEKMIKTVNQLEIKYRISEKDKDLVNNKLQLALAQTRLSKSQSWTIGIVSGAVVLLISTIILFQKQRLQLQKAKVAEQVQRVDQLKAVIDGEERERSRIGRQLHDDIMVELSIVKMGLNALPIRFPGIKHSEPYTDLVQQLNRTSQKLRQSAHNLMPDALLTDGLIPAINYFCNNIVKMTELRIHLQHYGEIPRFPTDVEISIYRIIQELVQNTLKHAQATNALVQLNYRENILSITVEDDGIGFDPARSSQENKMGLKSIQTRLKALNGTLDIHERMPHGSSVNITLQI